MDAPEKKHIEESIVNLVIQIPPEKWENNITYLRDVKIELAMPTQCSAFLIIGEIDITSPQKLEALKNRIVEYQRRCRQKQSEKTLKKIYDKLLFLHGNYNPNL